MSDETWRDKRGCTVPQRRFLDALTCQGDYEGFADHGGVQTPYVLYGGSGFGGKSDCLRTAVLELNGRLAQLGFPGAWGCIFCDTYNELADRMVQKMKREDDPDRMSLGDLGEIKHTREKGWHFIFEDPALGGCYLRNIDDPKKYKGVQFDWILVDELTTATRDKFSDLMYSLRSSRRLPFLAFGGATNPDGPGHAWVRKMWIDRDFTGESDALDSRDFVFVPAKAWDNPTFNASVEQRIRGHSDPLIVKARWEGSWDLNTGARFSQFNRLVHVCNWAQFEAEYGCPGNGHKALLDQGLFTLYGSFDYGTSVDSASAFLVHAVDYAGRVWTLNELWMSGMFLREQSEMMLQLMRGMKLRTIYADPALKGRDASGLSRFRQFRDLGIPMREASNDRVEGWSTIDRFLDYRKRGDEIIPPRWHVFDTCKNLIREISSAPRDGVRKEDIDLRFGDDHALDSLRYMLHTHFRGPGKEKDVPEPYSLEWFRQLQAPKGPEVFSYVKRD